MGKGAEARGRTSVPISCGVSSLSGVVVLKYLM